MTDDLAGGPACPRGVADAPVGRARENDVCLGRGMCVRRVFGAGREEEQTDGRVWIDSVARRPAELAIAASIEELSAAITCVLSPHEPVDHVEQDGAHGCALPRGRRERDLQMAFDRQRRPRCLRHEARAHRRDCQGMATKQARDRSEDAPECARRLVWISFRVFHKHRGVGNLAPPFNPYRLRTNHP